MTGPLSQLPRLLDITSKRASSWDRSGGNDDFVNVRAGDSAVLAAIRASGVVRHVWMAFACKTPAFLRRVILRVYWDGSTMPCIEAPIGDFFGIGHAVTRNYWSLPLQMSPEDGRGFNCWFPMPFKTARFEIENECDQDLRVYYYIDHEETPDDPGFGRFHAQWHRQDPCDGIDETGVTNADVLFGGSNLNGVGNYVILEAEGRGHYVGCNLNIDNLRQVAHDQFNWYGEGDDMIFVDGEPYPSVRGTGTEDYFNTAWCPTQPYSSPYHGITLAGGPNWSGKSSFFRFHIEDPIHFRRSLSVTIEHGHANRRSDDLSSTAYWYQAEPHKPFPSLPAVERRLPRPDRAP